MKRNSDYIKRGGGVKRRKKGYSFLKSHIYLTFNKIQRNFMDSSVLRHTSHLNKAIAMWVAWEDPGDNPHVHVLAVLTEKVKWKSHSFDVLKEYFGSANIDMDHQRAAKTYKCLLNGKTFKGQCPLLWLQEKMVYCNLQERHKEYLEPDKYVEKLETVKLLETFGCTEQLELQWKTHKDEWDVTAPTVKRSAKTLVYDKIVNDEWDEDALLIAMTDKELPHDVRCYVCSNFAKLSEMCVKMRDSHVKRAQAALYQADLAKFTAAQHYFLQDMETPNDRKITHWVDRGGGGKDTFARTMGLRPDCYCLTTTKFDSASFGYEPHKHKIIIISLAKNGMQFLNGRTVECLKNGNVTSSKYKPKHKLATRSQIPNILIMGNEFPDVNPYTEDKGHWYFLEERADVNPACQPTRVQPYDCCGNLKECYKYGGGPPPKFGGMNCGGFTGDEFN